MQPWHILFLFGTSVPCPVLTVASWPACRFLKRQVRWSGILISFRTFHSLLWSKESKALIVNKAEIDVFLELSCFFDDPADVGYLISGSSAFSKTSLNIWKFRHNKHRSNLKAGSFPGALLFSQVVYGLTPNAISHLTELTDHHFSWAT